MAGERGPLTPALTATCAAVAAAMAHMCTRWWIITSAAVALHGADPGPVGDVDVLMDAMDARSFCADRGIAIRPGVADDRFRSALFAVLDAHPLPVEIMAGLALMTHDGWRPIRPVTRHAVAVPGGMVYVPDRAEFAALLRAFGRPKDLRRAAALER